MLILNVKLKKEALLGLLAGLCVFAFFLSFLIPQSIFVLNIYFFIFFTLLSLVTLGALIANVNFDVFIFAVFPALVLIIITFVQYLSGVTEFRLDVGLIAFLFGSCVALTSCALLTISVPGFSDKVFKAAMLSGALLSVLAFFQYFNIAGSNALYYEAISPSRGYSYAHYGSSRALGVYSSPNQLAFVLGVTLLVSLNQVMLNKSYFNVFLLIAILCGVLFSGSRAVWLAVFIGSSILLAIHPSQRLKIIVLVGISILVAAVIVVFPDILDRLGRRAVDLRSLHARVDRVWLDAVQLIDAVWLLGVGGRELEVTADNEWLEIIIKYGVTGFTLLFLWFSLLLLKLSFQQRVSSKQLLGISCIAYFLVYSNFVSVGMFYYSVPAIVFSFIVITCSFNYRRKKSDISQ